MRTPGVAFPQFRMSWHEATVCDNAARGTERLKSESFYLIFSRRRLREKAVWNFWKNSQRRRSHTAYLNSGRRI